MKRRVALLATAWCIWARAAVSCPCQGSSGPAASVTTPSDVVGASVTTTTRFVPGAWLPNGIYAPLAPGERQSSEDVTAIVGYRPTAPFELSVETAVGHESFTSPDFHMARTAIGDTTVRARWDAIDEPMPYQHPRIAWPQVTLLLSLRMPTSPSGRNGNSNVFAGTTGSVGSSATSEGLGAWEPSIGAAFVRTLDERWQISAYVEGAYRFADSYLGRDRQLGPRFLSQLGARFAPTPIWGVGAFCYLRAEPSRLRWGAMIHYAPPFDGIGKNASQSTSFAVSLGYVFL